MRLSAMTTREKVIAAALTVVITLIVSGMAQNISW